MANRSLKNSRGKRRIHLGIPNFRAFKISERKEAISKRTTTFIKRRPMASFFVALGILLLLIIANTALTPKPKEEATEAAPKEVATYKIGNAPTVSYSAKVNKKGVIQMVAQMPGIVSGVNVVEGQSVTKGTILVNLASNYQGGNIQSTSRELAALQYNNIKDTYETQKGAIDNQRRMAELNRQNTDKQREITDQGINDTQTLINLNGDIISTLESNRQNLENTNVGGANDAMILATKQQISQFRAAISQLQTAQRQARFAADVNGVPNQLASTSYDLTLKQLEIQQKALDLSRESARLGLLLAQISEGMMYPAAPFDGVIQKVHVFAGQSVNPGTTLITIASNTKNATAQITLPPEVAKKVSKFEDSTLYVGKEVYKIAPEFVSTEVTDGAMNSITYTLPEDLYDKVSDGQYLKVDVPIGYADTISTIPYIPVDVVFQTQDGAFVYVVKDQKAVSRKVELGSVVGRNVAVEAGLGKSETLILDRNVIEGEKIKVKN